MTCRCAPNARCGRGEETVERVLVDDETFDRLTHAIENPRPPNAALIALFADSRTVQDRDADCPTCKGYGRITATGLHSRTCPACAGSGET